MYKKLYTLLALLITLIYIPISHALLSMELTQGVAAAIPIAISHFQSNSDADAAKTITDIISNDLSNSGQFNVKKADALLAPKNNEAAKLLQHLNVESLVAGNVEKNTNGSYTLSYQLIELMQGDKASTALSHQFNIPSLGSLRKVAHRISDQIYQQLTGVPGIFSTKLAYVLVEPRANKKNLYRLEIVDQDGYEPKTLLTSYEPIMSPAWSHSGREIAYVSFENHHAAIFVQDIRTGARRAVTEYSGINGAPAFSPDDKKLALVLSKEGSPNIYVMDLRSRQLKTVTKDYYINTEPAWSPDGQSLLFTSNRSGSPQIYQVNLSSLRVERLTYDGNYNARAVVTNDGKKIAMIHRVAGNFNIALQNLETGSVKVLSSKTQNSASPSIAPNGSMVLYDIEQNGQNVLAMASTDGRVQIILPARSGNAQDAAWSPFLG